MPDIKSLDEKDARNSDDPKIKAKQIRKNRVGLAFSLAAFWGSAFLAAYLPTDEPFSIIAPLAFVTQLIFSGTLASKLNRSGTGWVLGSLFTGTISSIVLLFKKKKFRQIDLIQAKKKQEHDLANEQLILTIARKQSGFVTPGQIALEGNLSLDEAKEKLEKLAKAGHAQVEIVGTGTIKYYFPEFAPDEDPWQG